MTLPPESSNEAGAPRPPVDAPHSPSPPIPPPGYIPPVYTPPAPRSGGILSKVVTSLVGMLLVTSIVLNIYLGIVFFAMRAGPSEVIYDDGDAEQRIVILPIEGLIDDDMHRFVRKALKSLYKKRPKALVLRVESGGGYVGASDRIWNELERFKERFKADTDDWIPIVASFGDTAASGGYYVAAGADAIVAERSCMTGSLGVMAAAMTFHGLLEKIGITPEVLVASESQEKDVGNNVLRPWTDKDRKKILELLDHAHAQFTEVVVQGRADKLSREEVKELADGRIFTANQAKAAKLIDDIGYLDQAIDKAATLAGIPENVNPQVTVMQPPPGFGLLGLLGASSRIDLSEVSEQQILNWMLELSVPRMMYQ